jgi:hypothetical protein
MSKVPLHKIGEQRVLSCKAPSPYRFQVMTYSPDGWLVSSIANPQMITQVRNEDYDEVMSMVTVSGE